MKRTLFLCLMAPWWMVSLTRAQTEVHVAPPNAPPNQATSPVETAVPIAGTGEPPQPLSPAELESLGLTPAEATSVRDLRFFGFIDFSFHSLIASKSSPWRLIVPDAARNSFFIGRVNLYLAKNLTDRLRTLGEVRFTYLPNGATTAPDAQRQSTIVLDYADAYRPTRWGGIKIERVYLEWDIHPLLSVRAGQFLTPYGVWNVDHGSPVIIPERRPYVVSLNWFPEAQTGFEFLGRWDMPRRRGTLGYHFTLSNGPGPISEYADLDDNKAVGARLFWESREVGELRIGASAFYGRDTDSSYVPYMNAEGNLRSRSAIGHQFDTLVWAGDVVWRFRGWHLQAEWISYQRAYTKKGRTALQQGALPMPETQFPANLFSYGGYLLAGYRFAWLGTMPFVMLEHINGLLATTVQKGVIFQVGLNVRPVDVLTLKLIYYQANYVTAPEFGPLRLLQAQAAWAF